MVRRMGRLEGLRLLLAFWVSSLAPALAQPEPSIEVAFSPHRGATDAVIRLIDGAGSSIRVAAYSFTSRPIAKALVNARGRGVDVRAILDATNATDRYSSAAFLANADIPTRVNRRYAVMHDKFMVIDGTDVETGSLNYTRSAEEHNAENVLILHGHPDIAGKYQSRWLELWDESEPFRPHS